MPELRQKRKSPAKAGLFAPKRNRTEQIRAGIACLPFVGRNGLWALRHRDAIRPPAPADLGIAALFQMPQTYGTSEGDFTNP